MATTARLPPYGRFFDTKKAPWGKVHRGAGARMCPGSTAVGSVLWPGDLLWFVTAEDEEDDARYS